MRYPPDGDYYPLSREHLDALMAGLQAMGHTQESAAREMDDVTREAIRIKSEPLIEAARS